MIYLVHHSAALDSDVDPQRPLSPEGRRHAAQLAADLAARGVRPDVVWHSGKLRARQTADVFRAACNPLAELSVIRGLRPTDPPDWIRERLIGELREVMMVGHFPSLPRILYMLTSYPDTGEQDFPMHGVVAIAQQDERWAVQWRLGGEF